MRLKLNDASQDGDVDDRINTIGYQKLQSKRFLTFATKKKITELVPTIINIRYKAKIKENL